MMGGGIRPKEIDKKVENAKERLYSAFLENYKHWWKEEDLHAYLYHLLLDEGISSKFLHREYRIIGGDRCESERNIGDLDLAVLRPFEEEFNFYECKVMHAIELKLPRNLEDSGKITAYSSRRDFAKDFFKDYGKLWCAEDMAENVADGLRKHILFFQKLDEKFKDRDRLFGKRKPDNIFKEPLKDYKKIKKLLKEREEEIRNLKIVNNSWRFENNGWYKFERKKFDDTYFSYVEIGPDGRHSPVLINWSGEPEALQP